jgi:hypothetical protein
VLVFAEILMECREVVDGGGNGPRSMVRSFHLRKARWSGQAFL